MNTEAIFIRVMACSLVFILAIFISLFIPMKKRIRDFINNVFLIFVFVLMGAFYYLAQCNVKKEIEVAERKGATVHYYDRGSGYLHLKPETNGTLTIINFTESEIKEIKGEKI